MCPNSMWRCTRLRLEEAVEFVLRGHDLAVLDPAARLVQDPPTQQEVVRQVARDRLDRDDIRRLVEILAERTSQLRTHLGRPGQKRIHEAEKSRVRVFLPIAQPALAPRASCDRDRQTLRFATLKAPPANRLGVDRPRPDHQPPQHAVGVPQKRRVRREVDVGLDRRRVEPQLVAADPLLLDGGLGQQFVDLAPRLRPDGVLETTQRRVVHHRAVVDARETSQPPAVVDAHDNPAQRLSLADLGHEDPEQGVRRVDKRAVALPLPPKRPTQVPVDPVEDRGGLVEQPRDCLVPAVVFVGDLEVGRLEVERFLKIDLATHRRPPLQSLVSSPRIVRRPPTLFRVPARSPLHARLRHPGPDSRYVQHELCTESRRTYRESTRVAAAHCAPLRMSVACVEVPGRSAGPSQTMAAMQAPERSQLLGLSAMLNVCQSHLDAVGPEFRPASTHT